MEINKLKYFIIQLIIFLFQNSTIKTQELNNIINLKKSGFQYINFASFSNGDMIFETSKYPYDPIRIFYGFKKMEEVFLKIMKQIKKIIIIQ